MGASIYDVSNPGRRGGPGKEDKARELSKAGCVKMRTREGAS